MPPLAALAKCKAGRERFSAPFCSGPHRPRPSDVRHDGYCHAELDRERFWCRPPVEGLGIESAPAFTCEAITTPEALRALGAEWDALWQRADAPYQSQSFAWALASWQVAAQARRLWVLVMRCQGRVVLIWPMTLRRKGWCRIAEALGSPGADYDTLLVEAGPLAPEAMRMAWSYACARLPADLVNVPLVAVGSAREDTLRGQGLARYVEQLTCARVSAAALADWPTYWAARGKKLRQGIARRQRRLEEAGDCEIRWLSDADEIAGAIQAMLAWKAAWARMRGLSADRFEHQASHDFLLSLATRTTTGGQMKVMAAFLDKQPIAISMASVDNVRLEGLITTYDPAFETFSPGTSVLVESLRWCGTQGLGCDMRIGREAYKTEWAGVNAAVANHDIALTARGVLHLKLRVGLFRLRARRETLRLALPLWLRDGWKALRAAGGKAPRFAS